MDRVRKPEISARQEVSRYLQRGFSMVEVSMVIALTIMVAMVGIPAIQGYLIESRVPHVAEDLQKLVARMKVAASGLHGPAYALVGQQTLIANLRDAAAVLVSKEKSVVAHGLGGAGVGKSGVITMMPAALSGEGKGAAFSLLLTSVNHAACPILATVLQRLAVRVAMGAKETLAEVKNSSSVPVKEYDPLTAAALCQDGDVNTFEFVFQ